MTDAAGFADRLREAAASRPRVLAALAGPPGAGKSTLAEALVDALNAGEPGLAVLVPMDGFHLDDALLRARGLLARKGAPETFDVGGLRALLARLRADEEAEVIFPRFDRALEIARAGAGVAPRSARIVLVEGNYLLLDEPPWSELRGLFDLSALIRCRMDTLERRLLARWRRFGFDPAAAREKAEGNDLPNARRVVEGSRGADIVIDGEAPLGPLVSR